MVFRDSSICRFSAPLFRSRDYQRNETELMIIVTPYIVKSVKPNEIAKPTDGFTPRR
ncbi:MAG: hypothetical protein USCAAHI_00150 [Beijerinckiaceae bacterium]|jgi:Flp pilus assembly secretin CpaC|nr:MAG: hypothetical protein USCAAHI_00150 [Beijerinckiaceae bacterium]